jgi:hypothetical protein
MVNFYSELVKLSESIYNKPTDIIDPFLSLKFVDSQWGTDIYYQAQNYASENVGKPINNTIDKTVTYIEDSIDYIKIALFLGGLYVISSFINK